ncbi:extracellular solute-binding protein [Mesorhizobium sp.]|uniref:extracellular solute-binding protein n=1 Tax=Mesorhizobium sp. TaxID=1871066 RepID=UPI0025C146E8|nr:extracellular solute-binding protein [Mesorhizobium sp.]
MKGENSLHRLSRRQLLKTAVAGSAAFTIAGLAAPSIARSQPKELMVTCGGGDWLELLKKAWFNDYAKVDIPINPQPYKGLAELKAMVEAKAWGQADIVLGSAGDAAMAQAMGLSEPIDYSIVDKSSLLPGTFDDNYIIVDVAASVLAWNTDAFPSGKEPKNWTEFFSPDLKSPRALFKGSNQTLEIATLSRGISIKDLYPFDITKALDVLQKVRDSISWYEGGAQSQQMISSREVDLAMLWINRADTLVQDKRPVNYTPTNTVLDGDAIIIPKGHPNKDAAMKFAAYMASPEPQARLTNLVALGPSNTKAVPLCDPARLARTAMDPKYASTNRFQDFKWLAANADKLNTEWNKWLLG